MSEHESSDRTVDLEPFAAEASRVPRGELIRSLSPKRSNAQRRHLKALAHDLQPVVMVGQRGAVPSVGIAADEQLEAHELIKVKAHESAPDEIETIAVWLARECGAEVIHIVGRTAVLFRQKAKDSKFKLPR